MRKFGGRILKRAGTLRSFVIPAPFYFVFGSTSSAPQITTGHDSYPLTNDHKGMGMMNSLVDGARYSFRMSLKQPSTTGESQCWRWSQNSATTMITCSERESETGTTVAVLNVAE